LRLRLDARDQNVLEIVRREKAFPSDNGWTLSWRTIPSRLPHTENTVANLRAVKHLKAAFAIRKLLDISPDDVESYLRKRMRQRALVKTALGYEKEDP